MNRRDALKFLGASALVSLRRSAICSVLRITPSSSVRRRPFDSRLASANTSSMVAVRDAGSIVLGSLSIAVAFSVL